MNKTYVLLVVYAAVLLGLVLGYRILEERDSASTPTREKVLKIYGQPVGEQEVSYNGEFFIDFPGKPDYIHRQDLLPDSTEYVHWHSYSYQDDNKVLYMVLVSEYPQGVRLDPAQTRLESELSKVLQAEGLDEASEKKLGRWEGHPSLDFTIEGGTLRQQGKLLVVENRTYRILAVYPHSARVKADFDSFVKSFRVVQLP